MTFSLLILDDLWESIQGKILCREIRCLISEEKNPYNFFSLLQDTGGIKFPDFKASGVYLRSQRMKLPPSVGQKKTKAIEQLLEVAGVDANPVPSEIMYVLIICFHNS